MIAVAVSGGYFVVSGLLWTSLGHVVIFTCVPAIVFDTKILMFNGASEPGSILKIYGDSVSTIGDGVP